MRTIVVTSGKGGVGKTTVATNLAVGLSLFEERVVLLDGDYAMGNVDLFLGLGKERSVTPLLDGRASLDEVLVETSNGLRVLPAATGEPELCNLSNEQHLRLREQIARLAESTDILVVDTASGISENVIAWLEMADDIVVVTSSSPAAWVDSYAVVKLLGSLKPAPRVGLLVNDVIDERDGLSVYNRIAETATSCLDRKLINFGHIVSEPLLKEAIQRGRALVDLLPGAPASACYRRLARRLLQETPQLKRCMPAPQLETVGG